MWLLRWLSPLTKGDGDQPQGLVYTIPTNSGMVTASLGDGCLLR